MNFLMEVKNVNFSLPHEWLVMCTGIRVTASSPDVQIDSLDHLRHIWFYELFVLFYTGESLFL